MSRDGIGSCGAGAMASVVLKVNEVDRHCDVDADKPLLWVLREDLQLTGTKYGCGIAMCGACTVLIETSSPGQRPARVPVRSCVVRAGDAQGVAFTTIEGLSDVDAHAVQQAWID